MDKKTDAMLKRSATDLDAGKKALREKKKELNKAKANKDTLAAEAIKREIGSIQDGVEAIAGYRDLLEQGAVITPPSKASEK